MFPAHAHTIRYATNLDAAALRRLAGIDDQRPLAMPALICEVGDEPAAALSLDDGRAITDPRRRTAGLATMLRLRATSIEAAERTPRLRDRLLAALSRVRPA